MFEGLTVALLTDAKLSTDWMTLFVGWQGIELSYYKTADLPFTDVQTFAIDQLAHVAETPDEWDMFRVADADPARHGVAVEDIFRGLADRSDVSHDYALRKWRYAVIAHDVPRIEQETDDVVLLPGWARDDWMERGHHLYDLITEWVPICSANSPPDISLSWDEETVRANFAAVRAWLLVEYIAITDSA